MLKKLKLVIPARRIDEPIIYKIVSAYNLKPNIIEASFEPDAEGRVKLSLEGTPADVEKGLLYLKELDIEIEELGEEDV